MNRRTPVNIIGAGLSGALLAVMLGRRGLPVRVFDQRPDPRHAPPERGRSINLVLAARGLRGLAAAGLTESVAPLLVTVRGRAVHEPGIDTAFLPYGQTGEVIHSVARGALNRVLIDAAAATPGVELHFEQQVLAARPAYDSLQMRDRRSGESYAMALTPTIAADGAGSAVRRSLQAAGLIATREDILAHDYKELTIPASAASGLDPHALHIWPRGGFMLMGLANPDGSFTATLFLPRAGVNGFESLQDRAAVAQFFAREFPTALPHLPHYLDEFSHNPQGLLGTVHCDRWHSGGKLLLLGDAAHAIVPFHGQGMNCAFEDCAELAQLLEQEADWAQVFAEFERRRRPQTEAIAQMALENYVEMRDTVRDPVFQRRKLMSLQLEQRHPDRFIPRYSMVMFHANSPYAEAMRRGAVQEQILAEIDPGHEPGEADLQRADGLILERLAQV